MAGKRALVLASLLVLALLAAPVVASASDDEFDEFAVEDDGAVDQDAVPAAPASEDADAGDAQEQRAPAGPPRALYEASFVQLSWMENAGFVVIMLYIVTFFHGRKKNETIALEWFKEFQPLLAEKFTHVSVDSDAGSPFMKESQNVYKLYATGGVKGCKGAVFTLTLLQRQDLAAQLMELIWPSRDMLTIEVPLSEMDATVGAIVRTKDRSKVLSEVDDLTALTRNIKSQHLPATLDYLGESSELLDAIMTSDLKATLAANERLVNIIHVTDQATSQVFTTTHMSRKSARFVFYLPPASKMAELRKLLTTSLSLINVIASFRLSAKGSAASKAARAALESKERAKSHQERQEALQQKKAEEKAKQRAELRSLSREEQKKRELKEAKKAAKNSIVRKVQRV